jgi:dynein heavy chain
VSHDIALLSAQGLAQSVVQENEDWQAWAAEDEPHMAGLPAGWEERLGSHFGKLLLIKIFREEKLIFACSQVGIRIRHFLV